MGILRLIFLACICGFASLMAQTVYFQDHKLPFFTSDSVRLKNALAGGLSLPQFMQADLNDDGWQDLIVFERADSQFLAFRNLGRSHTEDTWRFDPAFSAALNGCGCGSWALMAPYSSPDAEYQMLICGAQSGTTQVYRLSYTSQQDGTKGPFFISLYAELPAYESLSFPVNALVVQATDYPAFVDVDRDGDLDVLKFNDIFNGVQYYQNRSYEDKLGTEPFYKLNKITDCFGNFKEAPNGSAAYLNQDDISMGCFARAGHGPRHGGGSSILAMDLDNDLDVELIVGDLGVSEAYVLRNGGTVLEAHMDTVWQAYPTTGYPFRSDTYPGVYRIDADNDTAVDLIVAPSDKTIYEDMASVNRYRDTSQTNIMAFAHVPGTFLQPTTLDLGHSSVPVFTDINGDSLLDLLVGTRGRYHAQGWERGQLFLFLNIGTAASPAFMLADSNYLHIADTVPSRQNLSPAVGDIDSDGDNDLLVGLVNGQIMLYRNMAGPGAPANFVYETDFLAGIDVGAHAAPALHDVDLDGLTDLVAGNERGWLYYYRNTGTATTPLWTLVTPTWGQIKANSKAGNQLSNGYIHPFFFDYDNDGLADLVTGEEIGLLKVYEIGNSGSTFSLKTIPFGRDFGKNIAPAIAVLDSTGDKTLMVGNQRGGLLVYRTLNLPEEDTTTAAPNGLLTINSPLWQLMPNPARETVLLRFGQAMPRTIELVSVEGRVVHKEQTAGDGCVLPLEGVPAGLYLVRVWENGQASARKMVILPTD